MGSPSKCGLRKRFQMKGTLLASEAIVFEDLLLQQQLHFVSAKNQLVSSKTWNSCCQMQVAASNRMY